MMQLLNRSIPFRLNISLGVVLILAFSALFFGLTQGLALRLEKKTVDELAATNKAIIELLGAYNDSLMRSAEPLASVWRGKFSNTWQLQEGRLTNGGTELDGANEIADRFMQETGATATVFARQGDDFVRIATSLRKADTNERVVGTRLGSDHPAYPALMAGKRFIGPVALFGRQYMAVYDPILDAGGNVVGILFIGFDYTKSLESLKQRVGQMRIGETGKVWIVAARGPQRGVALVHPEGIGRNLLEDASLKGIIGEALAAPSGALRSAGSGLDREYVFAHSDEMGWVIIAAIEYAEAVRDAVWARKLVLIGCLGALVIVLVLQHILLTRWLGRPLNDVVTKVNQLATGDFTQKLETESEDEVGRINRALDDMRQQVSAMLEAVRSSADALGADARTIDSSVRQISTASRHQSESTASVAAAVEELTVSIGQTADNANGAHEASTQSGQIAESGGAVIHRAIEGFEATVTMVREAAVRVAQLGGQAEQISSVINVIREVSEQTNLLALNAAIEAARAGESGRGFAVVADEVRKLAERTGNSTREIAAVVQQIRIGTQQAVDAMNATVSQADQSVALASEAGQSIKKIRSGALSAVSAAEAIKLTLEEQRAVANDVAQNVERIAQMSESNTDAVAESAKVSEHLSGLAMKLEIAVQRFRLTSQ